MSNNSSININQTPIADIQKNSMINTLSQFKVAGLDEENAQTAVELKISKLGRLKLENSAINANKDNVKKSGETAVREDWESNSSVLKWEARYSDQYNIDERLRLDNPDLYAQIKELKQRLDELPPSGYQFTYADGMPDNYEFKLYDKSDYHEMQIDADKVENVDGLQFDSEYDMKFSNNLEPMSLVNRYNELVGIRSLWLKEQIFKNAAKGADRWTGNPVAKQFADIDALENKYSTDEHDTRINYYTSADSNLSEDSLWRYDAKFNVLLDAHAVKNLDESMRTRIDTAVEEMKEVEKVYEGNLKRLQFGAKLWDDGRVTYHARYEGCGSEDGIMADSADELLKMLMGKYTDGH